MKAVEPITFTQTKKIGKVTYKAKSFFEPSSSQSVSDKLKKIIEKNIVKAAIKNDE